MKKLLRQRDQIDRLDEKIKNLLLKRLDLSQEIIREKKRFRLPVTDTEREQQILKNISEACKPRAKEFLREVYKTILHHTKKSNRA